MPKINILNILSGDNQSTVVDKINYNFDQILSAGGGPQGQQGVIGATGPVGPQGVPGIQGAKGDQGNVWFVAPGPAGPTPSSVGDYWLNVNSPDQAIYQNIGGTWVNTGYGLSSGDIFQRMNPVKAAGGAAINRTAIILGGVGGTQTGPASTTLVLSDAPISGLNAYSPGSGGETYILNVNQEDSKLKIATEGRLNLISFSRSDLDVQNPSGNGINNPTISWTSPSSSGNGYDIAFKNPTGGISILTEGTVRGPILIKSLSDFINITSLGTTSGGVNILATKEITTKTTTDNISIFTAAANKGTFIRFNPSPTVPPGLGGFVEMNTNLTSATNSASPAFFANATGVGIGVGNLVGSTFKQNGDDPRKLAVLGNVSISRSGVDHETTNMFIGINAQSDYNKGSLFVRGHGAFGHNDPRTDETTNIITTGPSELGNSFPRLFVTASRNGQVFQVKNVVANTAIARTTMGDGIFDYNSALSDKTSAGYGPDLTQEFYANGGYPFVAAPLLSFQHKITNSTFTVDSTVFSISTFTVAGTYVHETVADKTLIQTKNSNSNLRLFANATSTVNKGNNKVIIGARNNSLIAVFAGTDTDPDKGTVTIGPFAEGTKGLVGPHDSTRVTFPSTMINSHSLSVPGALTIGTTNSYSAWSTFVGVPGVTLGGNYTKNFQRPVGNSSMLKINRIFDDQIATNGTIGGQEYNNLPNGLEIISWKSLTPSHSFINRSVAIAVGATYQRNRPPAGGFFVSDDGNNAAIGSDINYSVALNVVGSVNATTSITTPTVTATTVTANNINIIGGGSVTGGGTIPIGGIIMWSGSTVPIGWRLCDGGTTSGVTTPNLIDRFVLATSLGGVNGYGGNHNPSSSIVLTSAMLPKHVHGPGTLNITSSGEHTHDVPWTKVFTDNGSKEEVLDHYNPKSDQTLTASGKKHTHASTDFAGNTSDGGFANNALPHYNYYKLAFIMRVS